MEWQAVALDIDGLTRHWQAIVLIESCSRRQRCQFSYESWNPGIISLPGAAMAFGSNRPVRLLSCTLSVSGHGQVEMAMELITIVGADHYRRGVGLVSRSQLDRNARALGGHLLAHDACEDSARLHKQQSSK
jgi:hypothetical protein